MVSSCDPSSILVSWRVPSSDSWDSLVSAVDGFVKQRRTGSALWRCRILNSRKKVGNQMFDSYAEDASRLFMLLGLTDADEFDVYADDHYDDRGLRIVVKNPHATDTVIFVRALE